MEQTESAAKDRSHLVGIIPRIGALVLAVILFAVSVAGVEVIDSNEPFQIQALRDDFSNNLINNSLAASSWLIILSTVIVIVEIIAIVIVIFNPRWPMNSITGGLEIVFSVGVILCCIATGIPCAVYSKYWAEPPPECAPNDLSVCNFVALTAISLLEAGLCFTQIGIFGCILGTIFFTIARMRASTQDEI